MVSIIKNQLLKHLSRFTKNLSADKINLSTFKGEGELTNLELNEIVLTDLLELPSWLRITSAWCNKVAFKIPWRKLKSVPMLLNLDEVNITVETCEDLRPMSAQGGTASDMNFGEYGFIHKVIDGITVTVNTVNILFNSRAFTASVQISRIKVESKTSKWSSCNDLRLSRLKDMTKGQILLFKELEWQTVRIEAKSTIDQNLTPLRLITNQAKIRIVIKKRLRDCFIMGSKLVVILDDLLWVLTDSQLKAALHFLDSLAGLVQEATQITRKTKAARKLEEFPEYQAHLAKENRSKPGSKPNIFDLYDVIETSYHFISNQIVLHLCDDPGIGRSSHPDLKEGGALQISVKRFQIDFYPYHLAKGNRKHWPRYNESSVPHTMWQEHALAHFKSKFMDLIEGNNIQRHAPLSRKPPLAADLFCEKSGYVVVENQFTSVISGDSIKRQIETRFAKLMTTCMIMRIEDFTLYKVTTSGKKQQLKEFIAAQHKRRDKSQAGDRDHMTLPSDANIIHAEFIYYYYPGDTPFPLPPPKFYVQLNPIQMIFDVDSCLWLNSFALNLYQSLMSSKSDITTSNLTYIDVKIEAILPRINFESNFDYPNQRDRPKSLCFQVTRITLTNVRCLEQSSRADLAKCVDTFQMGSLFFGSEFPSRPKDFYLITQKFLDHISASDNIRNVPKNLNTSSLEALLEQLNRELLWTEAKDVWCISLDPVWGDFFGAKAVGTSKAVPFLDAIPVTIWLHTNLDPNSTIKIQKDSHIADIHALAHISNLVSLQINHYQYLFLLRLAEDLSELATFLSIDSSRILKAKSNGSLAVGAIIPQVEITFLMPSQCPGKDSSGGDIESFVPDTSSIVDEGVLGSTATVWQNSTMSINQENTKKNFNGLTATTTTIRHNLNTEMKRSISFEVLPENSAAELKSVTATTKVMLGNTTLQNNFNTGISTMKKGFTNFMSSFDNAFNKTNMDDMSDTLSIRSDASSDSETNSVNNLLEADANLLDLMFMVNEFSIDNTQQLEYANEVMEDDSTITTMSDHSFGSTCKRKDLVSISTFKMNKVQFLQQSIGYSSSIKIQIADMVCDDCTSIPWDEFQSKFSSRSRAWIGNPSNNSLTTKIKLRLDHDLILPNIKSIQQFDFRDKDSLKKLFKDLLIISVNDLILDLTMSTITGLIDLAEDEIIRIPMPLEITFDNVKLHLTEDRPPINITSPGPIPINLNVTQLYITRTENGSFNIYPTSNQNNCSLTTSTTTNSIDEQTLKLNKQLNIEIDELKRRLAPFERVSEENRSLRKAKEENSVLKSCLTSAQDENARLLDEKRRLLEEMNELRELIDKGRQWTSKR